MNKITVNGVEFEFGDDVQVKVDGLKISISAKPVERVVEYHHHHYPWPPFGYPYVFPPMPFVVTTSVGNSALIGVAVESEIASTGTTLTADASTVRDSSTNSCEPVTFCITSGDPNVQH